MDKLNLVFVRFQANTMTIYERVLRWSCLSCRKHSNSMGGAALDNAWGKVPLKVLTTCPTPICHFMLDDSDV